MDIVTELTPSDMAWIDVTEVGDNNVEEIPGVKAHYLEDEIRRSQTMDMVAIISSIRLTFTDQSCLKIPLYRMIPMLMVRPTLDYNLTVLENQFSGGYDEGARVFYVLASDE